MTAAAPPPDGPAGPLPPARPNQPLTMRQRRRLQPPRLAQAFVGLAVANLPPHHRDRYSCEFFAEMWGMPRARQISHAAGVLAHSWQLALALAEPDKATREAMRSRKPWQCRLAMHKEVRRYARDSYSASTFYYQCVRCGRDRDVRSKIMH